MGVKAFIWISFFKILSPKNKNCYLLHTSNCLVLHFVGDINCLVLQEDGSSPIWVENLRLRENGHIAPRHMSRKHQSWASSLTA